MVARKAVALIERGRSSTSCDGLLVVLLVVLIVGAPTVFLRSVLFAFAIPQLTMLWVTAMAVFLVGLYRLSGSAARDLGPRLLTSVWIAFASALALTTFFSPEPWVALIGLPGRGAGALTYGFGLVLLHTVYRLGRRRSVEPLLLALVTTHCLVVLYGLLQAYGLDPFTWPQTHVGRVVSTLGNPNFSAAYVGLTLPLLVWLPFGSARPRTVRIAGGAAVGASSVALCYFISFQGQVTALVAIAVLGLWVGQRVGRERFVAALLAFPTVAAVVVLPLLTKAPSGWFLFGIMVVLGTVSWITCWCEGQWDDPPTEVKETSTRRRWRFRWVFAAATLAGGILGAVLLGQRIAGEISSGLHHRVAYWKTSLSIFRSRPFVGTGLETFGSYLTVHRPRSYAVTWEGIWTDSPHSVPLGMLGGGGILLAGTYVLLMMVIGYFGYRAVRESVPSRRPVYVSVLAAWVGYHVQSLVSIDVPGLAYTQWVLGGVLLAGGVPTVLREGAPARGGRRVGSSRRHSTAVSGRQLAVAVVLGTVFLLSLSPLTAPFRGDRAFYRAQEALGAGDLPVEPGAQAGKGLAQVGGDGFGALGAHLRGLAALDDLGGDDDEAGDLRREHGVILEPALGGKRAVEPVGDLRHAEHHHPRGEQGCEGQKPGGKPEADLQGQGRKAAGTHFVSFVSLKLTPKSWHFVALAARMSGECRAAAWVTQRR